MDSCVASQDLLGGVCIWPDGWVAAQSSHVDGMLKLLLESHVEYAGDFWMGTPHIVGQVEEYECCVCIALADKTVLREVSAAAGASSSSNVQ
jgi:hypothetical protein